MSADDEWWTVVSDPIEDALSDCRNGHHGSGSVVLAEYVDQLRARVAGLEKVAQAARTYTTTLYEPLGGNAVLELEALEDALDAAQVTSSADHG